MKKKRGSFCESCNAPRYNHVFSWIEGLLDGLLPSFFVLEKLGTLSEVFLEKALTLCHLARFREDIDLSKIQPKTAYFISEARKSGIECTVLEGLFGYTNRFQIKMGNRKLRFEGLPIADFANKRSAALVDDKARTKSLLRGAKLPIADGKPFWFWQKRRAFIFGSERLGFPLVVKPRSGSFSRHVITNIQNTKELRQAIGKVVSYTPIFLVEKFIPDVFVHRATVIDFGFVACVQQVPANVTGDGKSTITELVKEKNQLRAEHKQPINILHSLVINQSAGTLLAKNSLSLDAIPAKGNVVFLQEDPFLNLGGDIAEVTPKMHPDNLLLFKRIARLFDVRVVGIDFLIRDISRSWKDQSCAILELNSLPCIELHAFPSSGGPQNTAGVMVKLIKKYYE